MSLRISYFEFRRGESKEHSPVIDGMTEIQRSINSKEQSRFGLMLVIKQTGQAMNGFLEAALISIYNKIGPNR